MNDENTKVLGIMVMFILFFGLLFVGCFTIEKWNSDYEKEQYYFLIENDYNVKYYDGRCWINISNEINRCNDIYYDVQREQEFANSGDEE